MIPSNYSAARQTGLQTDELREELKLQAIKRVETGLREHLPIERLLGLKPDQVKNIGADLLDQELCFLIIDQNNHAQKILINSDSEFYPAAAFMLGLNDTEPTFSKESQFSPSPPPTTDRPSPSLDRSELSEFSRMLLDSQHRTFDRMFEMESQRSEQHAEQMEMFAHILNESMQQTSQIANRALDTCREMMAMMGQNREESRNMQTPPPSPANSDYSILENQFDERFEQLTTALQESNARLTDELRTVQESLNARQDSQEQALRDSITDLSTRLNEQRETLTSAQTEQNAHLQDLIQHGAEQLTAQQATLASVQERLTTLERSTATQELQQQLEQLEQTLTQRQTGIEGTLRNLIQSESERLTQQITALRDTQTTRANAQEQRTQTLTTHLAQLRTDHTNLENALTTAESTLEGRINGQDQAIQTNQTAVTELRQSSDQLRNTIAQVRTELQRQQVALTEAQNQQEERLRAQIEESISLLRAQIEQRQNALSTRVDHQDAETQTLRDSLGTLNTRLSELQTALTQAQNEQEERLRAQIQQNILALRAQIEQRQNALSGRVDAQDRQAQALQGSIATLSTRLAEQQTALNRAQNEQEERLRAQIEQNSQQLTTLEDALTVSDSTLAGQMNAQQATITSLQDNIQQLREQLEALAPNQVNVALPPEQDFAQINQQVQNLQTRVDAIAQSLLDRNNVIQEEAQPLTLMERKIETNRELIASRTVIVGALFAGLLFFMNQQSPTRLGGYHTS